MSYERSLPMTMLPNDSHPGPGCSCAVCLRRWPDGISTHPDIKVEHIPDAPRHMRYAAVDADSYDAEVDDRGFYSRHPMGLGETYDAAVADLLEQLEGT